MVLIEWEAATVCARSVFHSTCAVSGASNRVGFFVRVCVCVFRAIAVAAAAATEIRMCVRVCIIINGVYCSVYILFIWLVILLCCLFFTFIFNLLKAIFYLLYSGNNFCVIFFCKSYTFAQYAVVSRIVQNIS